MGGLFMEERLRERVRELQKGTYDLHVHSAPSPFPRIQDGMEVIKSAERYGMAGVLLKSHYEPTATRAELINSYSNCKAKAYGGLVLNWPVGGLNPYAVANSIKNGAKIIWMPTRDSLNSLSFGNMSGDFFDRPGITILDEQGKLKPVVYEIMDLVKENDRFLATGHLSPKESLILCRASAERKVPMILTHPEFPRTKISGEGQKELADMGVLIEKNWFNIWQGAVTPEEMAHNIRTAGVSRVYIATDRGQKGCPLPADDYGEFIAMLLEQGFTDEEIKLMTCTVPKEIIHE
jgi:hypothetical protein